MLPNGRERSTKIAVLKTITTLFNLQNVFRCDSRLRQLQGDKKKLLNLLQPRIASHIIIISNK